MKLAPRWWSLLGLGLLSLCAVSSAAVAAAADDATWSIPATDDGLPGAGPIRRYPWFQQLWETRRRAWAQSVAQDQGALVFLGDSITQGWNVDAVFPGLKVANRGISGDTTRGVLIRLREDVLALHPRGVVLLIGTNDLDEGAEPETIAANLRLILAELQSHRAAMPVILCRVFPSAAAKRRPAAKIQKINTLYAGVARDFPQVTMLDTWTLFATDRGDAQPAEFPDLLHPNELGYAKWEKALRPLLETTGLTDAWPDDFAPEPGFTSLFDGRTLAGWHDAAGPELRDLAASPDGRFAVKHGRLVATVSREGDPYRQLYTTAEFPRDFVLKLEFRASPNADSGVYVRGPQLQCRDYALAGPYAGLRGYRPQEWNELVVTVRGGLAHATCNGEILIDAMPVPATGPIGLENDRGQVEYRRLRLRELP